jgi:hypothetical protein
MPATFDWIKKNVPKGTTLGALGLAASLPEYTRELTQTENKLKAIVKVTADWFTWTLKLLAPLRTYIISGALVKGFVAVGDAIKGIVRSTGSLQAALERLKAVQFSQQQLAPLVGGMAAAKQRVAELVTLSAKGPFRFEEIAAANRSLEVFTRGVFSSAKATQMVGQVAIGTGNNIGDLADAVGQLYQNLREGRSIESSVENLRQMGVVSDQAAQNLIRMSQAGATTSEVFGIFTASMQAAADGLGDMSDNLASVSAEHAKAQAELQKAFGAPWTQAEVENTKNMTAAMVAITPAVAKISSGFAVLYNGLSAFRTSVIRSVAELPLFQKALVAVAGAFQVILAAAVLFGTVGLASLIPKISGIAASLSSNMIAPLMRVGLSFTAATQSAIIFGNALRGIAFVLTGAGIIAGIAAIAGAIISVQQQMKAEAREAEGMRNEFDKTNQSIQQMILGASTLAQRQEALAKATNQVTTAHDKLNQAWKESHTWQRRLATFAVASVIGGPGAARVKVTEARRELQEAKRTERMALAEGTAGLTSPERDAAMAAARERARVMEEEEFQERMAIKTGPGKVKEMEIRAATLGERAEVGAAGAEERARLAEYEARKRQELLLRLPKGAEREKGLKDLQKEMLGLREFSTTATGAPTSVALEAQAERKRYAILAGGEGLTKEESAKYQELAGGQIARNEGERETMRLQIEQLKYSADQVRAYEEGNVELKKQNAEMKFQIQQEKEHYALTMVRLAADEKVAGLKGTSAQKAAEEYKIRKQEIEDTMALETGRAGGARPEVMKELENRMKAAKAEEIEREHGREVTRQEADMDLQRRGAEREGRSDEAEALQNREEFMKRMEGHRAEGMSDEESRLRAMDETAESIRGRETVPGGPAAIASSLARIGGGGGVYAPGGDPQVQIQKQIANLNVQAVSLLRVIAGKEAGVQ